MSDSLGDLQKIRQPTVDVLGVLLAADRPMYGGEIVRELDRPRLAGATVYAILAKLGRLGWIVSEREAAHGEVAYRTPREFHQLTDGGRAKARAVVSRWRAEHGDDALSDVDYQPPRPGSRYRAA